MIRQLALFLAAFIAFTPASAQTAPVPPPAAVKVALETGSGRIVVAVHLAQAPVTAANFLSYVDQQRLAGPSFYRGSGTGDYGFVQGGAQNDPKRILTTIQHDPTNQTGNRKSDGERKRVQ